MKYYGTCPGSCGELVQGKVGENEFLSSYCVNRYSTATIQRKTTSKINYRFSKALDAMKMIFEHFGEKEEVQKLSLSINSNIPRRKGMSSSSADIGAVIGACAAYLSVDISPEEASKFAVGIEATDTIFFDHLVLMDPLSSKRMEQDNKLVDFFMDKTKVLVLEPLEGVSTSKLRGLTKYSDFKNENINNYLKILNLFEEGLQKSDRKIIGQASSQSAIVNQGLLLKPYLDEIMKIAESIDAFGVNVAHSGTIVAVMIHEDMEEDLLLKAFNIDYINKHYTKKNILKIIKGGIRKENNIWNI